MLISGVPGAGKTTISYELLRAFDQFRIIEETDLIREILRGYNRQIQIISDEHSLALFEQIEVYDAERIFSFRDAKNQSQLMRFSLEHIINRQKRKGISTIINGVHIVPEILDGISENINMCFINLYFSTETELVRRLKSRNSKKYTDENISLAFQTNCELYASTKKMAKRSAQIFHNIDVSCSTISETLNSVKGCLEMRFGQVT